MKIITLSTFSVCAPEPNPLAPTNKKEKGRVVKHLPIVYLIFFSSLARSDHKPGLFFCLGGGRKGLVLHCPR